MIDAFAAVPVLDGEGIRPGEAGEDYLTVRVDRLGIARAGSALDLACGIIRSGSEADDVQPVKSSEGDRF